MNKKTNVLNSALYIIVWIVVYVISVNIFSGMPSKYEIALFSGFIINTMLSGFLNIQIMSAVPIFVLYIVIVIAELALRLGWFYDEETTLSLDYIIVIGFIYFILISPIIISLSIKFIYKNIKR